jgi:hypothetical protein
VNRREKQILALLGMTVNGQARRKMMQRCGARGGYGEKRLTVRASEKSGSRAVALHKAS